MSLVNAIREGAEPSGGARGRRGAEYDDDVRPANKLVDRSEPEGLYQSIAPAQRGCGRIASKRSNLTQLRV
jgi:hypothetical protein